MYHTYLHENHMYSQVQLKASGVKTTFVYFEKTVIKDLRFSLRVLFFKYTKKFLWKPRGCPRMFIPFAIPSRFFLHYELLMRRVQKEVKVYDKALLVRD